MSEPVSCPSCGSPNEAGRKFCGECGTALATICRSCGTPNAPDVKFCGECGTALTTSAGPAAPAPAAPTAERRLVSILFADLVGSTSASESRDAEETRELLSRYFDAARAVIERYGGTVEKFIGDAVMAVWGAPTAQEDDAERAVRAALELVDTIPLLDPSLRLRAAVLTGEAAVTLGAQGEGMVAGDLVNSASRAQGAAAPGKVLVGESTRRATEAAIAYEDAGSHELKGKSEPLALWRALRVVANRGGEGRSTGLEAPFVGRDRELRLVKDLFQGTAAEGKAHLVLVTGIAGIGKSRLAWEFEKYADGLTASVWWHRGRCPAYGEGVAYWALAEMIRGRAGILENESPEVAAAKLGAALDLHVPDAEDRRWIEPRLRHLLGLEESASHERSDLFAAWRLLFESLAATGPAVLVFEDLQWADAGLLDFVEYLLEWARGKPIFVIGLARQELMERRPGFGTASRGFTGLALEPLSPEAIDELLAGLVPGLPDDVRSAIVARAEGVPLYAVETVRMLIDRGGLETVDGSYRVVGELGSLAVPETLHALVASRLDELPVAERQLARDASVLGKTFVSAGLQALTATSADDLEPLLQSLVRKEVLFLERDPRSPEQGQYGFLQDLVRHVAYETLGRRDRKARHLAAAAFFEETWTGREQEVVEVVASHLVTALELDPEADDAPSLRARARDALARAGERAASLAANTEGAAWLARAAALADDELEEARLLHLSGKAAKTAGEADVATERLQRAIDLYEEAGESHRAARATADLGEHAFHSGRARQGIEQMERAFTVLSNEDPDEDIAYLASQLARAYFFIGDIERATERNELAAKVAESLRFPEVLAHALITGGLIDWQNGLREHALALTRHGLEFALEHDAVSAVGRGYNNASNLEAAAGNLAASLALAERGIEHSNRIGDHGLAAFTRANAAYAWLELGRWDEVSVFTDDVLADPGGDTARLGPADTVVAWHRGEVDRVRQIVEATAPLESDLLQDQVSRAQMAFCLTMAEERYEDALAAAEALAGRSDLDEAPYLRPFVLFNVLEAAAAAGRTDRMESALERLESSKPGELMSVARMEMTRHRAHVTAAGGDEPRADRGYRHAASMAREYGFLFRQAVIQLEHAERLVAAGRADEAEPLLGEAREIFEGLRATPWLERASRIGAASVASAPAATPS